MRLAYKAGPGLSAQVRFYAVKLEKTKKAEMKKQLTQEEVKAMLRKLSDEDGGKLEKRVLHALSCGTFLSFFAILVIAIGFQPSAGSALLAQLFALVGVVCLALAFAAEIAYRRKIERKI